MLRCSFRANGMPVLFGLPLAPFLLLIHNGIKTMSSGTFFVLLKCCLHAFLNCFKLLNNKYKKMLADSGNRYLVNRNPHPFLRKGAGLKEGALCCWTPGGLWQQPGEPASEETRTLHRAQSGPGRERAAHSAPWKDHEWRDCCSGVGSVKRKHGV